MVPSVGPTALLVSREPQRRALADIRPEFLERVLQARQSYSAGERSDHRALLRRHAELRLQRLPRRRRTMWARQRSEPVEWHAAARRTAVGAWRHHAADAEFRRAALHGESGRQLEAVNLVAQR